MARIGTGKEEEEQTQRVERGQSGSQGAAQDGCKAFHQLCYWARTTQSSRLEAGAPCLR